MKLRPLTMNDADFLLTLKNYPETRKFAIVSKEEINRTEHLFFIEHHLEQFQVIMANERAAGVVRISAGEISIWIDRECWGMGIATWVIRKVSLSGFIAKIVNGNIASMKSFIRAGYEPISYQNNYYIFQK